MFFALIFRYISLLFIGSLCSSQYRDDILLIEHKENGLYNMKCVATGHNSTSSDLAWFSTNLSIHLPQWSSYSESIELFKTNLLTKSSLHYHLPPVTDYRFEDFETYISTDQKEAQLLDRQENVAVINLSIRFKSYAIIVMEVSSKQLCAIIYDFDLEAIEFRECFPQPIYNETIEDESPWKHYIIFRGAAIKYYVKQYEEYDENLEYKIFNLDKLEGMSNGAAQWRIHKYQFHGKSVNIKEKLSTTMAGPFQKKLCISLFVFLKSDCEANIYISSTNSRGGNIDLDESISETNKWIEVKADKPIAEDINNLDFQYIVSSKNNATCGLFAISFIQNCSSSGTGIIELDNYEYPVGCRNIRTDKVISYKTPLTNISSVKDIRQVDNINDVNCKSIKERAYCQMRVICTSEGCHCPSGSTGDWCEKNCPNGRWGYNCDRLCSHCVEDKCFVENGTCKIGCQHFLGNKECPFSVPEIPSNVSTTLYEFYNIKISWCYPIEKIGSIEAFLITITTINDNESNKLVLEKRVTNNETIYKYNVTDLLPSKDYEIHIQAANIYVGKASLTQRITTAPPIATMDGLPRLINYNSTEIGIQIPPIRHVNNDSILYIAVSNTGHSIGEGMPIAREDLDILKYLKNRYPDNHQHKIIYRQHVVDDNSNTYINLFNVILNNNLNLNFTETTVNIIIRNEYKNNRRFAFFRVECENIFVTLRGEGHFSPLYLLGLLITIIPMAFIYVRCIRKKPVLIEKSSYGNIYDGSYLMTVLDMGTLDKDNLKPALERLISNNSSDVILKDEFNKIPIAKSLNRSSYKRICSKPIPVEGWRGLKSYIIMPTDIGNTPEILWSTVWDERCPIIVSLTSPEDVSNKNYSRQCSTYSYGGVNGLRIDIQSTDARSDYVLECIKISKRDQDRMVRKITYSSWNRDGLPTIPLNYFRFLNYIKYTKLAPIIIHCSDGRRKADAFILYHSLLFNSDININIPNKMDTIMSHYPQFLLDFHDYKFAYYVIDEHINGKETNVPIDRFVRDYNNIYENIDMDFNYVHDRKYIYDLLYSDYAIPNIDTHFIGGFDRIQQFVTTCQPFPNNRNKFWKLVYNYGIKTVVVLQNIDEIRGMFWPNNNITVQWDTLEISKISSTIQNYIHIYKLVVDNNKKGPLEVTLLYYQYWNSTIVPDELDRFYNLYDLYKFNNINNSSTVLCCRDGITACGLFVTLDLLIEKSKCDNQFDLCWAVLSFRHRHSLFMSEKEQYRFLHEFIKIHIERNKCEYNQYESIENDNEYEMNPSYC